MAYLYFKDKSGIKDVVDVSGQLTKADIVKRFGGDYNNPVSFDPTTEFIKEDGSKGLFLDEVVAKQTDTVTKKTAAIDALKSKLNLSDTDISNFKEVLK